MIFYHKGKVIPISVVSKSIMNAPLLPRIDQSKLRESVYNSLHKAFTRGDFAPGDVVNLRSLASQLGTSMTPVREAVRRLVAEGALIDTPSRTLEVPAFDPLRMQDLMRARIALETLVTELAITKMDATALAELEAVLARPSTVTPDEPLPDLVQNYDFHFTLYRRSESPVLLPLIEGLWLQYGPYLHLITRRAGAEIGAGNDIHRELLDAVQKADAAAAKTALIRDIERSFALLVPARAGDP